MTKKTKPREFLALLGPFDPMQYPKKRRMRPLHPTESVNVAAVCDWLEVMP